MEQSGRHPLAARRARWLAEVDEALAEAEKAIAALASAPGMREPLAELSARVTWARAQADMLRRRPAEDSEWEIDPLWMHKRAGEHPTNQGR